MEIIFGKNVTNNKIEIICEKIINILIYSMKIFLLNLGPSRILLLKTVLSSSSEEKMIFC